MTERRAPRWSELRPLLQPRPVRLDPTRRRLERAATIRDLRAVARRHTPRAVFDYTDGGADAELSLRRSREAFTGWSSCPHAARRLGGRHLDHDPRPVCPAATGLRADRVHRMMHHEGESAVARVAERIGIPYALSTMGTTSVEQLAIAAPLARRWFQLYLWRDRESSRDLVAAPRPPGTRRWCSPSTSRSRGSGCGTSATA
jgi:L-lactate dehydrogenase (cytochrome)